jgi:hypothetical protein
MRFRQVHLDFHTSPLIPDIGSRFDAGAFGQAFRAAHVDSVTLFAKCHHGHSYHPTRVGSMHPGLGFNLLRAQIDALHAVGIRTPVYLSATWDEHAASTHPEWRIVAPDNSLPTTSGRPERPGWAYLDYATGYLDYLCAQTDEVLQMFPDADGIFMDISFQLPSISQGARAAMTARGLDWTRPEDREAFAGISVQTYFDRVTATVRQRDSKMPLFFNSGHIRRGLRQHYLDHYTHLELESLPTAGWGYEHFPLSARYVEQMGLPFLGMTGKFHWLWGEVGGYKTPDALIYECGAMLAQGARCSIGDHLHPTGQIDATTMRVIAPAYRWVAEREPWCQDTVGRAEIGLLSVEAAGHPVLTGRPNRNIIADDAAVRVLMEGQFSFDVLDRDSDFSAYRLIILPDEVRVDAALAAQLRAYLDQGGRLLMTGESGLAPEGGFALDIGAEWLGRSAMAGGDYLLPDPGLRADGVDDPLFMYRPSEQVRLTTGLALGQVFDPYFDRTLRHFSGHVNAPSQPDPAGFPAIVEHGAVLWAAHPVFTCYHQSGAVAMLQIAERLILRALGRTPMIRTSLPRAGRATLRHSTTRGTDILHLMHATPALRGTLGGQPIQPIQDLITLSGIEVSLAVPRPVAAVTLVPEMTALDVVQSDGRITFRVPRLRGHQMVEVTYDDRAD